jgi:Arc/MetJ-type ribon-helix-helix transcriptional regulator
LPIAHLNKGIPKITKAKKVLLLSDDYVTIKIPRKLHNEINKKVKDSQGEFKDAQEYIQFVLTEVIKEDEEPETAYTPEEEKEIKKRLKQLGYL